MSKTKRTPKAVLQLPDLEQSKSAVLNSLASQSSQRSYDHAILEFIEWYCSEPRLAFNKTVVTRYRIFLEQAHYASSTINLRLAAVRHLAYEAADAGLLSPDLAAGIRRVKGAKKFGVRLGNRLTAEQGKQVLGVFDRHTLRGIRDYAMVAVLLGCGYVARKWQRSVFRICSNEKNTGFLRTSSAKAAMFGPFRSRSGLRLHCEPGWWRRKSTMVLSSGRSTKRGGLPRMV